METAELQTKVLHVQGMTCVNCQNRIEKKLKSMTGIDTVVVSYEAGTATVSYDGSVVTLDEIHAAIESLGFKITEGKDQTTHIIGTLIIIFALYMLLRAFSTSDLATAFPVAQTGMGYGMVLIIGLITSVHCIAMCGGINLSQTLKTVSSEQGAGNSKENVSSSTAHSLFPAFLYNAGRLVSYTAVGVVVGALGSVITVSGRFQGAVLLLAGIFMLVMGINMLGLFPALRRYTPRLPRLFTSEHTSGKGPLVVGFLNGFMPCGPLQAMQLYALSTGSPIQGGISMFLFCLGTIPLMFALGAAGGILSGAKGQAISRKVMYAGAILIAAMGLAMLTNGWNLAGMGNPLDRITTNFRSAPTDGRAFMPEIQNGVQIVNSTLLPNRYPAIVVQEGIPVRWNINAPAGSINGCNNRFVIREYNIQHTFSQGDNVIEFLPARRGKFSYSCWMGMIRSTITVLGEGESIAGAAEPNITPTPAGVDIPTDEIAIAQLAGNFQTLTVRLTDDGFEPAIAVMQRQLPALWNIIVDSFDPGNSSLIFPTYYTVLDVEQGDNPIQILPTDDFDFSTEDNIFYCYVKVVDDINNIDIEAIKAQVAEHETLIYPPAYFEMAMAGGGASCCRR